MFNVRSDVAARIGGASSSSTSTTGVLTPAEMKRKYEVELEKTIMKQENLILDLEMQVKQFEKDIETNAASGDDELAEKSFELMETCKGQLKEAQKKLGDLKVDRTKVQSIEMQNAHLKLRSMKADVSTAIMGSVTRNDIEGLMRRESQVHDSARERDEVLDDLEKMDAERANDAALSARAKEAEKSTNPAALARKSKYEEYMEKRQDMSSLKAGDAKHEKKSFESELERIRRETLAKKNRQSEKEKQSALNS